MHSENYRNVKVISVAAVCGQLVFYGFIFFRYTDERDVLALFLEFLKFPKTSEGYPISIFFEY